ncbi:protein kinase [Streptomyces sp. AC627_RSS907]|uniref:protein kinase n=1 Tax=Streptomyces sp. AC627_RSS907 TaxID=2823684 RepID=UPI001C24A9E1|nr:protein kinase [Streptomyces sp. AC627_RSS907]
MDDYAGRVLADRYRLPLPPSDEYELTETRAFDTYSGQEVLVRQVPLPEVVEAEVLDADGLPDGFTARDGDVRRPGRRPPAERGGTRRPADPVVRRAVEAAQAAAAVPDHPRLDQVFDVFAEGGSLWIVSELVAARPLAALLAEQPLTPYRAAEVASDILLALRVLHAYGWVHRNITARTVLVCDDGRVMLTGLAVGAAEEALCGYDPVPAPEDEADGDAAGRGARTAPSGAGGFGPGGPGSAGGVGVGPGGPGGPGGTGPGGPGSAGGVGVGPGGPGGPGGTGPGAGAPFPGGPGLDAGPRGAAGAVGPGGAVGARGAVGPGGADSSGGAVGSRGAVGPAGAVGPRGAGTSGVMGPDGALDSGTAPDPAGPLGYGSASGSGGVTGSGSASGSGGVTGSGSASGFGGVTGPGNASGPSGTLGPTGRGPEAERRAAIEARGVGGLPVPGVPGPGGAPAGRAHASLDADGDVRAARAGAIAAYRAGARAAARVQEAQNGRAALPGARPAPDDAPAQPPRHGGHTTEPGAPQTLHAAPSTDVTGRDASPGAAPPPDATGPGGAPGAAPPGQIVDPYGVRAASWHGATSRTPDPAPAPAVGRALSAAPRQEAAVAPSGHGDDGLARTPARHGPATALAAERARQARMAVVGPVTERWAPEQAGPVHENWQLAAPIGPATDLWALGALLFRAVQGHAPYPEESTAELVQIVCAEPPAFAEECGPLRPVVESLLRQDPTERLDFEELRGWLRSLVRSAPEPDAGLHVVPAPPADTSRLPIVRRRGELVRRRRAGLPTHHGRHKRARRETARSPRSLGRTLLLLILLALAGAIAYAMYFMPKSDTSGSGTPDRTGAVGEASQAPPAGSTDAGNEPRPEQTSPGGDPSDSRPEAGSAATQTTADGFALRKDPEGFSVAVAEGWNRTPRNGSGQVVYGKGDFELIVVPGRDRAAEYGDDPMVYQRDKEPELGAYRASSWSTSSGLKNIEVGGRAMAEGQFIWTGADGDELYVRNIAMLIDGRYHVVQVRGPEAERDEVTRVYEQASTTYQYTG